jgi:hypothetical protein
LPLIASDLAGLERDRQHRALLAEPIEQSVDVSAAIG